MNAEERGRRRFLKDGAALAGLAVGAGAIRSASGQTLGSEIIESEIPGPDVYHKNRRAYGVRSRFETATRSTRLDAVGAYPRTPLHDQTGIITPSALFAQIGGSAPPPDIDPRQHRFLIHGMVDHPLKFTMEDLKRLPSVTRIHFIECGGNSSPRDQRSGKALVQTHGVMGCAEWTGVLLSLLLQEAGVQKGANWLILESADADRHSRSIPLEKGMDDVLVAYGQNGEALRPEQGYPLRAVVPGWHGNINIKWLRRIKVADEPAMAKSDSGGEPERPDGKARWFQFEMGLKSVITFPSLGQRLSSRGFWEIRGLAWSGGGAIRRVEVSTDGGRSWKDAQLQEPVHRKAFTLFRLPWSWDGEEAVLQSRCTDERGDVQPTLAEYARIFGVNPEYFHSITGNFPFFNPIQSWKVSRDGSVQNAFFTHS
ncbi:MAG: sulfite dehydrogenase [Acidobacteria bacterium RIFCSPLOWO2_12_FULL_60_22]|nr:MAG: sulfite dehydrogenase [Acidobacteria bacterium RIFCSPLOWO2_12_FULL_60_22]